MGGFQLRMSFSTPLVPCAICRKGRATGGAQHYPIEVRVSVHIARALIQSRFLGCRPAVSALRRFCFNGRLSQLCADLFSASELAVQRGMTCAGKGLHERPEARGLPSTCVCTRRGKTTLLVRFG